MYGPEAGRARTAESGLTVTEMMIVIAIVAILVSIAVPSYRSAVQEAEVQATVSDLESMSDAIGDFVTKNGKLPESLAEVGYGDTVDPWGRHYVYLPLSTNTMAGEIAEVAEGEERLDLFIGEIDGWVEEEAAEGRERPGAEALADFLRGLGGGSMTIEQIRELQRKLDSGEGINTDFDFYSAGPDGETAPELSAAVSQDDVVRAENGGFFGEVRELLSN